MKKLLTVFVLATLTLYFSPARAQMAVGLKGGLSYANLSGFDGNSRVTGHVGLFLHYSIHDRWQFQPELIYSGEGERIVGDGSGSTIALAYVNIPLMIQYFPAKRLYFEAGPQLGFLAGATSKDSSSGHLNLKRDFSNSQFAINLGAGVIASKKLGFYVRYDFGLTDIYRFNDIQDHSRVCQVGVTLRLK